MTVLRDPVERTLSFLRHQAERRQRGATEDTPLVEIYEDPFRFEAMIQNHMTRMLSLTPDEMGPGDGVLTTVPYTRERLEMAKEALAGLDLFGLQSRFDEFCGELGEPLRPRRRRAAADEHDRSRRGAQPASPTGSPRTTRSTSSSTSTLARSTRSRHRQRYACTASIGNVRTRRRTTVARRGRRARRRRACARRHRAARRARSRPTPDDMLEIRLAAAALRGLRASSRRRRRSPSGRCRSTSSTARPGAHPRGHAATISTPERCAATSTSHGSVLVRGLLDAEQVDAFVAGHRPRARRAQRRPGRRTRRTQTSWYLPLPLPRPEAVSLGRHWVAGVGWHARLRLARAAATSCSTTYATIGLRDVVTDYLGERPVLSANKCTLRRVPLTANTDWHQDGAFLGNGIRALNVWVALTDCGVDAPGMDLVPRRFERVVETGTGGAIFDWAVGSGRSSSGSAATRRSCDPSSRPATRCSSTTCSSTAPPSTRR